MTQEENPADGSPRSPWQPRPPTPSETPAAPPPVAQEPSNAISDPEPRTVAPSTTGIAEPPAASPPTARRTQGLPPWLPYLALAVVPAIIVGGLVYALAGGSSSSSGGGAAGLIENFFGATDPSVTSYKAQLPPSFPQGFPSYPGAKVVISFTAAGETQTNYFAIYTTSATPDDVFTYYLEALDEDPWQVEIGRSATEFTGLRFTRPDDPDLTGEITFYHSDLDNTTSIQISFEDLSGARLLDPPDDAFKAEKSRELPAGFPKDVPIYEGNRSIVIDTYFAKQPGGSSFIISFLTKGSQQQVIDFYNSEFQKAGFTLTDSTTATGFAIGRDFHDAKNELTGSVVADTFEEDDSYTKVDLVIQVAQNRTRGN